jgi:predicted HTH transcriptional regulator
VTRARDAKQSFVTRGDVGVQRETLQGRETLWAAGAAETAFPRRAWERESTRQTRALAAIRVERRLTNARYRALTGASSPTAKRDLEDLIAKGLLIPRGAGRGAYYELTQQRLRNGSIGSPGGAGNGS